MERKIVFTPMDVESVALVCTTCGSEVVLPGWSDNPTWFPPQCQVCGDGWDGEREYTLAKELLRVIRSLAEPGERRGRVKITLDSDRQ